ncbi:MAG: immunoglobulin domain-containing protein [Chitinophagales bacterium]
MEKNNNQNCGRYYLLPLLLILIFFGGTEAARAQCTPQPNAPNIALSNYTPCAGSQVTVAVTSIYLPNANWIASIVFPGGVLQIPGNGNYNISPTASGNVYVYIQNNVNGCPSTYQSGTQAITVLPGNKVTAQSDTVLNFCPGDSKFLYVKSANAASTYTWKKNGTTVGSNNDTLFLNNLVAGDTGVYKCFVSSSTCATDSSKSIRLKLGSINGQSGNLSLCTGSNGILWVNAPTANNFVWKLNGVAIANSNNDTLFFTNYVTTQAGTYTCEATQNGGCLSTASFTVSTNTNVTTFDFTGVIASYPMSGNANNAASALYNGTVNAGCSLTADRNGNANKAYNFDGTASGTINMGDITPMNGAGQLSVTGWFKRTNNNLSNEYFSKVIDSAGLFCRDYSFNNYTYNTFGNNTPAIPVATLSTNWFHYAMTFNGGAMKIYINGTLAAQFTNAARPTIQSAAGSSFILGDILGAGTISYPSANFLGQMDEINIFNRDLNAAEILPLMNAPQFLQHPQNVSVCSGNTITLSVQAENPAATYQWQKNGVDIGGANSATYTKANAQVADAGSYTCVIAVACNRAISKAATVTVSANSTSISSQPQAQSKCVGQPVTFSITATGGTGFQWKKNGVVLAGQTASTLNLAAVAVTDTGTYTCDVLGGSCGTLTSAGAYLTVNALPNVVISGPSSVCAGSSVTLTASGASSYSWSPGGNTTAAITVTPTTNTNYAVIATDVNNCTVQATKLVTRNALPVVTLTPATQDNCSGFPSNLTAGGAVSYNWSNGLGTGTTKSVSPTLTTTYTVTGTDGNTCSNTATATVNVLPTTAITTQPQSQTTCVGGQVTLSVVASGANLNYQWKKGGVNIPLATSANYLISSAVAGDAGTYTVEVSGTCGPVLTSNAAVLTVTGSLQISQQPVAVNACAGSNAYLAVLANGANLSYSWSRNGAAIANSNNDTLYLNNITAANAGSYVCNITSSCGTATSNAVTVAVKQPTSGTINQTICFGASYTFNGVARTQSGTYFDTLSNAAGCDSLLTLNLTVRQKIQRSISRSLCNGSSTVFNGQTITTAGTYLDTLTSVTGCDSFVVLTVTVAQSSSAQQTVSVCGSYTFNGQTITSSGTYLDTITNVAGCDSFITLNLTIKQPTASTIQDTICSGSSYSFGAQTLNTSGTYTRTILNAAGCDSVITLNLFVRQALIVAINNNGWNLTTTAGFTSYQWNLNGNAIAGANGSDYTAVASGNYSVQVTDVYGCQATSAPILLNGVGVKTIESGVSISLYPNPVQEQLVISTNEAGSWMYMLRDISGRLIQTGTFEQETRLNMMNVEAGLYVVQLIQDNRSIQTFSITKQ